MSLVKALEKRQQESKILDLLARHDEGLTRVQIGMMLGEKTRDDVLLDLRKQDMVEQKRAILENGQITMVYALKRQKKPL